MEPKSNNDSLRFGYYFVAFIDVLNQREALRVFKELPKTEDEKTEFIQAAKKRLASLMEYAVYSTSFLVRIKWLRTQITQCRTIFNRSLTRS